MTLRAKGRILDAVCLAAILLLVGVFYYPTRRPLESRYVYFADPFERARLVYGPECAPTFRRFDWEEHSPLATLLARYSLTLFPDDPGRAVLAMHLSLVFVSAAATFLLARLYVSTPVAFFVTALLFCGRTSLPITRGLGVTTVHLLVPLSLLALYAFHEMGRRPCPIFRKAVFILTAGACLACIYVLGCHETFYGAGCLALGLAVVLIRWVVKSIAARRLRLGPLPGLCMAFVLAAGMGIGMMAAVWRGLPEDRDRTGLSEMIGYKTLRKGVDRDLENETRSTESRRRVWRGTFLDGRYLTRYGRHHENAFLCRGPGFNGIIPLFVIPGFLIGLVGLSVRAKRALGLRDGGPTALERLFVLFLGVLLALFVGAFAASADPKPTRYTFSIFAVLVLSAQGYEWLFQRINARCRGRAKSKAPDKPTEARAVSWLAVSVVCAPLLFLAGMRLRKNYLDLGTYVREYEHQIPTIALGPALDKALAHRGDHVVVVYCRVPALLRHPAVGLWMKFRVPSTIRLVDVPSVLATLPPTTTVITVKTIPSCSIYHLQKRNWPNARGEGHTEGAGGR